MGRRAVRGPRATEVRTEAIRVLRSNLLVAVEDVEHPVVVVTSAKPGEGKTTTCDSLARSLADSGKRVVVVDLDLRQPDLHQRLGTANEVGAVDVLTSHLQLAEVLHFVAPTTGGRGFYFLAAGPRVTNPTELLGTAAAARLLTCLAAEADIVLVDSPPVLPVADTLVVARRAAGVLLVVEAGRTSLTDVRAACDALERNGVRVLGVALNKLDAREVGLGYGDRAGAVPARLCGADGDAGPWAAAWSDPEG